MSLYRACVLRIRLANRIARRVVHVSLHDWNNKIDAGKKSSRYSVVEGGFAFVGALENEIVAPQRLGYQTFDVPRQPARANISAAFH